MTETHQPASLLYGIPAASSQPKPAPADALGPHPEWFPLCWVLPGLDRPSAHHPLI